ncbi:phosphopantetheine-binding protein [Aquimarina sp. 2201CG14-23]|uniref:phosphopantetheine-binding protein n=1 Tax=Aquimarina mycalae TaxID=3040073 RepID=UPI00247827F8|nr:phosphopantetheine-binding protein [Aquimarina sp. 2201CG14-23]MDH7446751.1 phosphopantetheine-binding protein [Aquimarina sp. 2201CG14-23]
METSVIVEKVDDFLIEEFEVEADEIAPDANLKETLDLDSLDYVDLVVAIEAAFGVKLVGDDFVGVESFQDFYDLIERKVNI